VGGGGRRLLLSSHAHSLANKRLKLSSSRGGGIQERQESEAIEESMMLMNCKLRARSLSADR
jgi:hypothetical protein